MDYRELLKLYKSGELDEETEEKIKKDIERQDAISDYLFDEQDAGTFDCGDDESTQDSTEMLGLIQKSIRKAFAKMGIAVAAAVLAVIALCAFVLPGLVSEFYYDPNEIIGKDPENKYLTTKRGELDVTVYTEMFLPDSPRSTMWAESEGWGNYRVTIPQTSSYDRRFQSVDGYLSRGKLTLYNTNILKKPADNAFFLPESIDRGFNIVDGNTGKPMGPAGTKEEAYAELNGLNENEFYSAYVSLSELMDYEDFISWYSSIEPSSGFSWAAVYTENEWGDMLGGNMGFQIRSAGHEMIWDNEKYPYLCPFGRDGSFDRDDAEQTEKHFTSMLNYLRDYPQFMNMMSDGSGISENMLNEMIESVERDGLRIYGMEIQTKKDTLLKLSEDPNVGYIYTRPMY